MIGLLNADALRIPLADGVVQTVVTSPPYYGLRDYGTAKWEGGDPGCDHNPQKPDGGQRADRTLPLGRGGVYKDVCGKCGAVRKDGQLGLEKSPEEYVAKMVDVFREVKRVLRGDGTLWLNMGDSYARNPGRGIKFSGGDGKVEHRQAIENNCGLPVPEGLKEKDLIGIPWRLAFALQADGWYLRSDIIWHKPNPMPESVTDRPTKAHEYLFLLSKSPKYYYDIDGIREEATSMKSGNKSRKENHQNGHSNFATGIPWENKIRGFKIKDNDIENPQHHGNDINYHPAGRNCRTVWTIPTAPYKGAHFATYPPKLVEPCIKAGTSEKGCCPKCGKPWVRVVERITNTQQRKLAGKHEGEYQRGRVTSRNSEFGDFHDLGTVSTTDLGWQPACSCNAGDPTPCLVFDPFAGSGTTLLVARQLGRHGVGCDLSYTYLHDQARVRLELDKLEAWTNG